MSNWNYEDDLYSQDTAAWGCQEIRKVNDLLNAVHRNMTLSLQEEETMEILDALHQIQRIMMSMNNTFFKNRIRANSRSVMTQNVACLFEALHKARNILNAVYSAMTPSLHEEGTLEILAELQVTKEITLDMEQTYFRYRKLKKWSSVMPKESALIVSPEQSTLINGE